MRTIYLFIFFSCLAQNAFSQSCLPNGIVLSTQAQIDSFPINYPGCSEVLGNLVIGYSVSANIDNYNIINLLGLSQITKVSGKLYIYRAQNLHSLAGLDNLTTVDGDLSINFNDELNDVSALSSLTKVGEILSISGADNLSSLTGLENIISLGSLYLGGNYSLSSLDVFSNITRIDEKLEIFNCDGLQDLYGLHNIDTIGRHLSIAHNNGLNDLSGLEGVTFVGYTGIQIYSNHNLTSLNGLNNLKVVETLFRLLNNNMITDLSGLDHLTELRGSFRLEDNDSLIGLGGIDSLEYIRGRIKITNNDALVSLDQLMDITFGEPPFGNWAKDLIIEGNEQLPNLNGLENMQTVGKLSIKNNANLSDISAITGLNYQNDAPLDSIVITNNPLLPICHIPFVCDHITSGTLSIIHDNAPGCNTVDEVHLSCDGVGKINYPLFIDLNENTLLDTGEPFYPPASVLVSSSGMTAYGNAENGGLIYVNDSTNILTYNQAATPNWGLTGDSSSYTITLSETNYADTVYFGLKPNVLLSEVQSVIHANNLRCNSYVTFDVIAENPGTLIANGTIWLLVDENILDVEYIDTPDVFIAPNRYGWHFSNFIPGSTIHKQIKLLIPGPPDFPLGESLHFITEVDFTDVNGDHESAKFVYTDVMECSFDPNDKLVNPVYYNGYALLREDLVYTVRFQNTGNAPAYDVTIRDTLSPNLDLNTFQIIASSHQDVLSTTLSDGRALAFLFKDIFLPDSTADFTGSQGYVMYRIRALDDLPEGTTIQNSASIYFDLNPAVVTNTTENTMFNSFDVDEDGFEFWNECDDQDANVNPNMIEIPYNGIDEDCNALTLDDDLDQDGFSLADDCDDENSELNPGMIEIPYNGIDEDCNGLTLDDDLDQDGFLLADDCDDENSELNPGMIEIPYNGIDEDCNGLTLDDDLDQDGFLLADDCDDENSELNPSMIEIPYNGIDEDCNGLTLDDDLDQDGYLLADDCDDENSELHPGMIEIPYNGIDEDCNALTLDDDLDQDGYLLADDCDDENAEINPNAEEIVNNDIDEDCDGENQIVATKESSHLKLNIFPNPTRGTINIRLSEHEEARLKVLLPTGEEGLKLSFIGATSVDLSNFPKGIYFFEIETEGKLWVTKIARM